MNIHELIKDYGQIIVSMGTLVYFIIVRMVNIKQIQDGVACISSDIKDMRELNLRHEGRIARLEGKVYNGNGVPRT